MTVLLRKRVNINGQVQEIKVFHPSGELSRQNQEHAEALDKLLAGKMPLLTEDILCPSKKISTLRKWYLFSEKLREIIDDSGLVVRNDVENGLIWEAIKQHLPDTVGLKGAGQAQEATSQKWGSREHLAVCYAITYYDWKEINWLLRWDDWCKIYHRGSMWRDKRVIAFLKKEIMSMETYPKNSDFTQILKNIAAETTGKDITVLDDSVIAEKVYSAVAQVTHHEIRV